MYFRTFMAKLKSVIEPSSITTPVTYNNTDTTITLTTSDLNKVLVVDNASDVEIRLPSVGSAELGDWLEVHKVGAGAVTITAADSDTIMDSAAGGNIANTSAETWAWVNLRLVRSTRWNTIGMLGLWGTT